MELVNQYLPIFNSVLQVLGGLCITATIMVRIPGLSGGKAAVDGISGYWTKLVQFLPTLGVNPQTKKLEEALKAEQDKK